MERYVIMVGEMDIDRFPSFPLNLGAESHRGRNKEEKLGSRQIDRSIMQNPIMSCYVSAWKSTALYLERGEDTKERNNNQGRNGQRRESSINLRG